VQEWRIPWGLARVSKEWTIKAQSDTRMIPGAWLSSAVSRGGVGLGECMREGLAGTATGHAGCAHPRSPPCLACTRTGLPPVLPHSFSHTHTPLRAGATAPVLPHLLTHTCLCVQGPRRLCCPSPPHTHTRRCAQGPRHLPCVAARAWRWPCPVRACRRCLRSRGASSLCCCPRRSWPLTRSWACPQVCACVCFYVCACVCVCGYAQCGHAGSVCGHAGPSLCAAAQGDRGP